MRVFPMIGIALVALAAAPAPQEVPRGVRYVGAATETNLRAESRLQQALSQTPFGLGRLGGNAPGPPLFVGPFLSGRLIQERHADPAKFAEVEYTLTFSEEIKPVMKGLVADSPRLREALDAVLTRAIVRNQTPGIRKLRPDEMALIWFYIGWDITEPVFAVDYGTHTFIVDFDEAGETITWLEDISRPCFRVGWSGGGLKPCYCTVNRDRSQNYSVAFQPQKQDGERCTPAIAAPAASK